MTRSFPLWRSLAALGSLLAAVTGCSSWDTWQREKIFAPARTDGSWYREPLEGTDQFDLALASGDKVHAWYWQNPDPKAPAVLYLHGSRWNLNGSAFRIERWADMGFSVLAIDYRGFGKSTEILPSETSAYEDATAALLELARRQPDPSKRFVYGHSLGGAVAVELASQATPAAPFAGLIVESSFTSIGEMVQTTKYGWIPGLPILVTQDFNSKKKMWRVTAPVLIIHGTSDSVIPHTMSDQLLAAATSAPPDLRRLLKVEGASHSNASRSGPAYVQAVQSFVRDASKAYAAPAAIAGK